jgi:hypothetical protein
MDAGPAQRLNEDQYTLRIIKRVFGRSSIEPIPGLLVHHKADDPTHDVEIYQRNKAPTAPQVSGHHFRFSSIPKHVLFTCPSIDSGFEMIKHSQDSKLYL